MLDAAGCDVRLHPISALPPGADGAAPEAGTDLCWDQMFGYATMPGGTFPTTTGGGAAAAAIVRASDPDPLAQFQSYADRKSGSAVIQIEGIISFAGSSDSQIKVASNTTIFGADDHSGFTGGGLNLAGSSNIVIRNLVISKAAGTDAVTIQGPGSTNIWIDHCDFSSEEHPDGTSYDGLVDITHAADFITVSWTRFTNHDDIGIIGHSDSNAAQDTGSLHVTYDHDLFQNVQAGPRVRFGTVHIFSSLFDHVTYYAAASTMGANVLVEKNYLASVTDAGLDPAYGPITTQLPDSDAPGFVDLVANYIDSASAPNAIMAGQTKSWTPPYIYMADSATTARAITSQCAGPRAVGTATPRN
jgi:pectate lyase